MIPVSIQRCPNYNEAEIRICLEQALIPFGGLSSIIKPGDKVLLKPNLLFARPPEQAVTTHPAIVEAVAKMALDCGAKVSLGDSPPFPSVRRITKGCGIAEVTDRLGITLVEFKGSTHETRKQPVLTRHIKTPPLCQTLLDYDVIINLPKLKSHQQMFLTGAVKNLFGCVLGRKKAYWHFKLQPSHEDFAAMLLGIYEQIQPELTIVDAILSMEGNGPGNGTPIQTGLILAGQDAIAVDRVITELTGANPNNHFVIKAAAKLGFPSTDLNSIMISGISLEEARFASFQLPEVSSIGFSLKHIIRGLFKNIAHLFHSTRESVSNNEKRFVKK